MRIIRLIIVILILVKTIKRNFLNVIISDEEESKLEDKIPNLNDYIERLSAYMQVQERHIKTMLQQL